MWGIARLPPKNQGIYDDNLYTEAAPVWIFFQQDTEATSTCWLYLEGLFGYVHKSILQETNEEIDEWTGERIYEQMPKLMNKWMDAWKSHEYGSKSQWSSPKMNKIDDDISGNLPSDSGVFMLIRVDPHAHPQSPANVYEALESFLEEELRRARLFEDHFEAWAYGGSIFQHLMGSLW